MTVNAPNLVKPEKKKLGKWEKTTQKAAELHKSKAKHERTMVDQFQGKHTTQSHQFSLYSNLHQFSLYRNFQTLSRC